VLGERAPCEHVLLCHVCGTWRYDLFFILGTTLCWNSLSYPGLPVRILSLIFSYAWLPVRVLPLCGDVIIFLYSGL
jgi:hypothetical protein